MSPLAFRRRQGADPAGSVRRCDHRSTQGLLDRPRSQQVRVSRTARHPLRAHAYILCSESALKGDNTF